jgi:hypothetical protein
LNNSTAEATESYLARLGDFIFALKKSEFQTYSRSTSWRWVSVNVLKKAPRLHFAGKGEDKIKLEGIIYPDQETREYSQIEEMRKQGNLGKPLPFTYANVRAGEYLGKWVILNLSEERSLFNKDGSPMKMTFSLEIQQYPED